MYVHVGCAMRGMNDSRFSVKENAAESELAKRRN